MNFVEEGKRCSGDDDDLGKELCTPILASRWKMCPVSFLKLSNSHANSHKDLISVGSRRVLFYLNLVILGELMENTQTRGFQI